MFDFPIFEMPTIGLRMLMAINAIIHVFVSHGGAVGGSVVLALAAWWTNKKNDLAGYETVYRLLMVFFIITTSVGALTGIGMWIHANIISPNAIGGLIRVFFWKWFIEWIVFNFEVILLLFWFMTWKPKAATAEGRSKSVNFGIFYAVSSWVTMLIITAILGFMLTPNFDGQPWIDPEVYPGVVNYNNALFNPTWIPGLMMRTFSSIAFAGALAILWTWLITSFSKDEEIRATKERMIKFFATIMMVTVPVAAAFGYYYLLQIPEAARAMIPTAMMTRAFADNLQMMYMIISGIGGAVVLTTIIAYFSPKRMPYIAATLMVAAFMLFWGFEERTREFIRKPYLIYNYMYANGIRVTDVPYLNKVGILKHAVFVDEDKKVLKEDKSNLIEVGHTIAQIECRACHTENGINGLKFLTKGWSEEAIRNRINNLPGGGTPYMPPFTGTEAEKDALAAYIASLNKRGEIK
ncbi:cytochrome c [Sulfuricurvum sp.]|uniref:cytochrome c n=1 Tax=Sulfuricurvum sp. TaxID=2025608 RepID=UPI00356AAFB8